MNHSEMVRQLKRGDTNEAGAVTEVMLLELMQYLQERFKKTPDEALNSMTIAMNNHLIAQAKSRYSVMRYFSGDGPIAQKLREYHAITQVFQICSYRLDSALQNFNFKPVEDAEKAMAFRTFLVEVSENAFAVPHKFAMPLPYEEDIEIGLDTGIHTRRTSYAPDAEESRTLVLAVEFKNGMKVKYVVKRGEHAMLLYYHPYEEVWLVDNGMTHFEGVHEALLAEWEKIANECGYTTQPIDVEENLAVIQSKVTQIFDNEEHLPEVTTHYVREPGQSYLQFEMEEYSLLFINTKGQWPDRNMVLSTGGDGFRTKVEFSQMREFARQELIKVAHAGLDQLLAIALAAPLVVEPEPTEPAVAAEGQVSATEAPVNYNPVWKAMQAVKEQK